jgi:hypothetical protein
LLETYKISTKLLTSIGDGAILVMLLNAGRSVGIGGIAHVPPSSLASASSVDGSVGVSALPVLAFAVFA